MYPSSPDEPCPDYNTVVSRSGGPPIRRSNTTSSSVTQSSQSSYFVPPPPRNPDWSAYPSSDSRRSIDSGYSSGISYPSLRRETYLHSYDLKIGAVSAHFLILVEPSMSGPNPGKCRFHLSLLINGIERDVCEPVELSVRVDPKQIEFVVFIFPGKVSSPAGCLHSFRVWLRCRGMDHRLFAGEDLWVGRDPDFNAVEGASFARKRAVGHNSQTYQSFLGRAPIIFIIRWEQRSDKRYDYTLEYEAGGIGNALAHWSLRLENCDPSLISFVLYSVPMKSSPRGSCHRLRLWLKTGVPLPRLSSSSSSQPLPFNESFIYQRLWKSDEFKVGGQLTFDNLSSKATMATPSGPPRTIITSMPMESSKTHDITMPTRVRMLPSIPSAPSIIEEEGEFT